MLAVACHEIDSPAVPLLRPPINAKLTQSPPQPVVYTMSSAALSYTELTSHNFPYDTWIAVQPNGPQFQLTAFLPAKPESQAVTATGASGGRNGCDLNASVAFGQFVTGFGLCGGEEKSDTVLARGQGFIRQGSFPLDFTSVDNSDCPPRTSGSCHVQDVVDISFTVSAIPVTLRQVKAVPRTAPFNSVLYQQVVFSTGADPDSLTIGGARVAMPITTTSWVYTAGDGTLDGNMCNGGFPIVTCSPFLHKAGRMVVKGFVGGWEQTSTVTIQCLVTPADSMLNDSTSDFSLRETLLDALTKSNPDSAAGVGATAEHRGFRHEEGGRIYRWHTGPNVGKYFFSPVDDPNATECHVDTRYGEENETYLGASVVGYYHVHPVTPPDSLYGCLPNSDTGEHYSQYPGDGLKPYYAPASDSAKENYGTGGGSLSDWLHALSPSPGHNEYIIYKDGTVYRLGPGQSIENNSNYWSAFGAARDPSKPAAKCTWPKKYSPT
jgi:hypothetical protein